MMYGGKFSVHKATRDPDLPWGVYQAGWFGPYSICDFETHPEALDYALTLAEIQTIQCQTELMLMEQLRTARSMRTIKRAPRAKRKPFFPWIFGRRRNALK